MKSTVRIFIAATAIWLSFPCVSSADGRGGHDIPPPLLLAYAEAEPAALSKSLSRCQSENGMVYRIKWTTGYETGTSFLTSMGSVIAKNWQGDAGQRRNEYNEAKLVNCVLLQESKLPSAR
ncbi:MAG: hypothetical protein KIS73_17745 [Enhydrobacter sp.]|nr:hypothetical protein [Enhydrobacter sp.]